MPRFDWFRRVRSGSESGSRRKSDTPARSQSQEDDPRPSTSRRRSQAAPPVSEGSSRTAPVQRRRTSLEEISRGYGGVTVPKGIVGQGVMQSPTEEEESKRRIRAREQERTLERFGRLRDALKTGPVENMKDYLDPPLRTAEEVERDVIKKAMRTLEAIHSYQEQVKWENAALEEEGKVGASTLDEASRQERKESEEGFMGEDGIFRIRPGTTLALIFSDMRRLAPLDLHYFWWAFLDQRYKLADDGFYTFLLENGFLGPLAAAPPYETWSADFSRIRDSPNKLRRALQLTTKDPHWQSMVIDSFKKWLLGRDKEKGRG